MKKQLYIVLIAVFCVLLIDQVMKVWVKTTFDFTGENSVMPVFGNWFRLLYIENQGMAFGTTFGASIWAKLGLSIFRIFASCAIAYYFIKQWRRGAKTEFLLAIGLVFAGATGNLIDSMFYDFIFEYDPCISFNHLKGSGVYSECGPWGTIETRHTGFLLGNVVDMFQFTVEWPSWVPWYDENGDNQIFPAIWNVADGAISIGVIMIIIRQRKYFPKENKKTASATPAVSDENNDKTEE
ncbi:lipoprotein signal peptidase [compost metagenome]